MKRKLETPDLAEARRLGITVRTFDERSCWNCRHFAGSVRRGFGECRIYPPKSIRWRHDGLDTPFPPVRPTHWCSRFDKALDGGCRAAARAKGGRE